MKIEKFKKQIRGFTLIELIIVIGILSVLSISVIVTLNPYGQFQKANDVRRKSDLAQTQKALEVYYQDNGKYPLSTSDSYQIQSLDVSKTIYTTIDWGSSWRPYMNLLPKDPISANHYVYYSPLGSTGQSDGQSYYLYANLERGDKDSQACNGGSICANVPVNTTCGGVCNYGITSPDTSP